MEPAGEPVLEGGEDVFAFVGDGGVVAYEKAELGDLVLEERKVFGIDGGDELVDAGVGYVVRGEGAFEVVGGGVLEVFALSRGHGALDLEDDERALGAGETTVFEPYGAEFAQGFLGGDEDDMVQVVGTEVFAGDA